MSELYRSFFGLKREPFAADLKIEELLETPATKDVRQRFHYAVRLGAICVVTGEVGSGKSTALRWAAHGLHPSEYKPLCVTATSGAITELYKQIVWNLDMEMNTTSRARLTRAIRSAVVDLVESKELLREIPDGSIQLVVTSPPYNIGKPYEKRLDLKIYVSQQEEIIRECVLKPPHSKENES